MLAPFTSNPVVGPSPSSWLSGSSINLLLVIYLGLSVPGQVPPGDALTIGQGILSLPAVITALSPTSCMASGGCWSCPPSGWSSCACGSTWQSFPPRWCPCPCPWSRPWSPWSPTGSSSACLSLSSISKTLLTSLHLTVPGQVPPGDALTIGQGILSMHAVVTALSAPPSSCPWRSAWL